jgi:SH3 domain protein
MMPAMHMLKKLVVTTLIGAALLGQAQAETRYVTDELKITLRSGESSGHRILRMVTSGTPVEVLASNPETGYSHVRVGNTDGYVLTRQLLREPPARDKLAVAEARIAELTRAPGELQQQLDSLQREHQALTSSHAKLQAEKQRLETAHAALQRTSADAVRISEERNALRKQVADLTRETQDLKLRTNELENSNLQQWFLAGAGVLAGGLLLGLILPNLSLRRRRSNWDSL